MEPVLPTFLAAFLAEWGDPTQLLTIALVSRFPGDRRVSIGITAAALANGLLSAYFGTLVAGYVNFRALTLLIALALLFAGFGMMLPVKPPKLASYGSNSALVVSFLGFGILAFGDKTQFVTMAIAASTHSLFLAGCASAAGIVLANVPAMILGDRLTTLLPIRALRIGAATLLALAGCICVISALQLV